MPLKAAHFAYKPGAMAVECHRYHRCQRTWYRFVSQLTPTGWCGVVTILPDQNFPVGVAVRMFEQSDADLGHVFCCYGSSEYAIAARMENWLMEHIRDLDCSRSAADTGE